jgi:hypothetical protein
VLAATLALGCSRKGSGPPPAPKRTPAIAPHPVALTTAPLEAGSGDVGAAAPTIPLGVAKDGSWVALCQARNDTDGVPGLAVHSGYHGDLSGDRMVPYLVRGGGLGIQLDRLVAASRSGRYVAFIKGEELVLFDAARGTIASLPKADVRGVRSRGGSAALVFSTDGTRAVYFRRSDAGTSIVIRELESSNEREVVPPRGIPFVVEPDPTGSWARLAVVAEDSDHDGKLSLPEVETNRPVEAACAGRAVSYSEYGFQGDRPTQMWIRLDTGEVLESKSLLRPVGEDVLLRADDDAIMNGTEVVVPASCHAMVKAVLPDPLRVIVMCKGDTNELPVEIFGPGFHISTAAKLNPAFEASADLMDTPFFCSAYNGCIDVRDGKVVDLHGGTYRARYDNTLYIELAGGFALLDPTHRYMPFPGGELQALGVRYFVANKKLTELASGKVVGTFSERPIAIDASGRALVNAAMDANGFPTGPLRWVTASAP